MYKWLSFISCIFYSFLGGVDYAIFDSLQGQVSYESVNRRINEYLKKDSSLDDYFLITDSALFMFASVEDKDNNKPEFMFTFSNEDSKCRISKCNSLQGVRIAIDPGHFGGDLSFLEKKYIDINTEDDDIQFNEGDIALATAKYLKKLLIDMGAEVIVTRESNGKGVYEKHFFSWMADDFNNTINGEIDQIIDGDLKRETRKFWMRTSSLSKIFRRLYNPLDLQARADKINSFAPDITLIIHYNFHGKYDKNTGKTPITKDNTTFSLIPGAFAQGELSNKVSRAEFVRLAVTDHIDKSIQLSKYIAHENNKLLKIPFPEAKSFSSNCIHVSDGVFCRNLLLTRLVHSPLCYSESLLQNNEQEYKELIKNDDVIDGLPISNRLKQVAQAHFRGILRFYGII